MRHDTHDHPAARSAALRNAVRVATRAEGGRKSATACVGLVLAGVVGLAAPPHAAAAFPPELELSSLLTANGGDGSVGFVLDGIVAGDKAGTRVSAAGDVNGDGIEDLIVGATADGGQAYVVFGNSGGFPAELQLSDLLAANGGDGSAGFLLNRIESDDQAYAVGAAGDFNGDGIDDIVVGAKTADPGGRFNAGQTYVVFGRDQGFPAQFELSSLLAANGGDGSAGVVFNGITQDFGNADLSGASIDSAGDVNNDGIDDLIVGALGGDPGGRTGAGESYVLFGRDTTQAGNFPAEFELSSLLTANGGDGSAGFVLNGIAAGDASGRSVGAAGDVNGDGISDVIVGAARAAPGGRTDAGESYVVFGRDTAQAGNFPAELELSSLLIANGGDGSAGFVLSGIDADDDSGGTVSAAGDINGDGIGDVIVGAHYADPGGESYVVFGTDLGFAAEIELSSLLSGNGGDGSSGFVLNGIDPSDRLGYNSVSAAGDINGDGIDDLIVGASGADPGGRYNAGETYVVFGQDQGFPAEFELSNLLVANGGDGSAGFVLNGIDGADFANGVYNGDYSGGSVSAVGDINGDGAGDVMVGASYASPGGRNGAGESYVIFGQSPVPPVLSAPQMEALPNEMLAVPVEMQINGGAPLAAATIELAYDDTVLDPTACTVDPASTLLFSGLCNVDFAPGIVRLTLTAPSTPVDVDATLAQVDFDTLDVPGTVSPLTPAAVTFTDANGSPIPVDVSAGSVTVFSLGDVNCDSLVDGVDAMYILQAEVGQRGIDAVCPTEPNGPLADPVCDVSADAVCNVVDGLFIQQCEVGFPNPSNPLCPSGGRASERGPDVGLAATFRTRNNVWLGAAQWERGGMVVPVHALVQPAQPLGVTTIEVQYDPQRMRLRGCEADPAAAFDAKLCHEAAPGRVRLNVIATAGRSGTLELARLRFQGGLGTELRLDLRVETFADVNGTQLPFGRGDLLLRPR